MTSPHNPFANLVRDHVVLWKDATRALDVDRKTFARWLAQPDRITVGTLQRMATVFRISETELLAAAIATVALQRCEELRGPFVVPTYVDFCGADSARKPNPNCN